MRSSLGQEKLGSAEPESRQGGSGMGHHDRACLEERCQGHAANRSIGGPTVRRPLWYSTLHG